jgi:hypothetical protein
MRSWALAITFLAFLFGNKQPAIELDPSRWILNRLPAEGATVEIRTPDGYRVRNSSLPQTVYKRAQRLLLDLQYDFVGSEETSQFQIKVHLVRLVAPLETAAPNANELDGALSQAFGHPINGSGSPMPVEQEVRGTTWIYYDNSADVTYTQTRETYGTVVDNTTVLLITGWYGPKLRKDPKWFESRKQVLRAVRDNTRIVEQ